MAGYADIVVHSWNNRVYGSPIEVVWKKLKRLQKDLGKLTKHITQARIHLAKAIDKLIVVQQLLGEDKMNNEKIEMVKHCTKDVITWNEINEEILKQRSKIE